MIDDYEMLKTRCAELNKYSSMKAIQILEVLSCCTESESIAKIAEVSGLSSSTVHRILQDLVSTEYVLKDSNHKYSLSLNAMALGTRIRKTDIITNASESEMEKLNKITLETIHLIVLDNFQGRYIAKLDAKNQIGLRSRVGWNIPLHCTAGGKVLLAYQTEEWLKTFFLSPMKRYTEKTIVTEEAMRKELKDIRDCGYGMDNLEHNPDVLCIAAPIFDANGKVVATIGVSAPSYRFSYEKALSYKDDVVNSANNISARLRQI